MDARRSERVAGVLRDELEEILNYELEDPRIATVRIVDVIVPPHGRRVVVRVFVEGDELERVQTLRAVDRARSHIRKLLAERINLFHVPDIHFERALAPVADPKLRRLMRKVRKGRPRD